MKDIIIALFSAMGGALVTFTITTNYYSKGFIREMFFRELELLLIWEIMFTTMKKK